MVWKFNDECKLAFLYAYFCGDGTFYKNRLSVASISYDLINDVSYMLSMFGVRGSIVQTNKEKTFRINNNKNLSHSKGVRSFRMYNVELTKDGKILKVDKNCYHSSLAEKETFEVPYYSEKLKKTGKKKFVELLKQKEYLSNSIGAQKLKYGDLTLLQVKSIEEIVPDYEYVYDFSVPIHENFIGGQQPICLHNSTVEGGMITTDDESYFNILKMKRSHGWDRDISEEKRRELRKIQGTTKFNQLYRFHTDGFNFRNNEIGAFLGLRQLDKLGSFIEKRHRNFLLYNSLIENDYWKPVERENCVTSNLGYPLISPKLDEIVEALRGNNVEVRPLISGNIGLHPFYEKLFGKKDLPFANKADEYGCYLPNHQSLTEEEIKFVCDIVNRIINKTNT